MTQSPVPVVGLVALVGVGGRNLLAVEESRLAAVIETPAQAHRERALAAYKYVLPVVEGYIDEMSNLLLPASPSWAFGKRPAGVIISKRTAKKISCEARKGPNEPDKTVKLFRKLKAYRAERS